MTQPKFDADTFRQLLRGNPERALTECESGRRVAEDPERIRSVGVIGGGTAGFFAALAIKTQVPWVDVTLVESSEIPIIGVGEATTPHIIPFLHGDLGLDIVEFYERVRPTWKQGIKFEWGLPGDYHFHAPFDWNANNVGVLGSLAYEGNINAMTLQAIFMEHNVTGVLRGANGDYRSILPLLPFAYHINNRPFVQYLHIKAVERGVTHLDRKIENVVLAESCQTIDHLMTTSGEKLQYDLYIDCTGFRSMMLGEKLRVPFNSYADSLFTDRAIIFNTPHGGKLKPYTSAISMEAGWTWNIPQEEEDHCGYVYSSGFCTDDAAEREARSRFPDMTDPGGVVRFRVGRRERAWEGNVVAVGNSYGFVEPLESSGLYMALTAVKRLCAMWPRSRRQFAGTAAIYNQELGATWDSLRWFLSIHYKFNKRFDTPFWQAARAETDVSGAKPLLDSFAELAPLNLRSSTTHETLRFCTNSLLRGALIGGYDCLLLGQQVPCRLLDSHEDEQSWRNRQCQALSCADAALPMAEALRVVREHPELLRELVESPQSWLQVFKQGTFWPQANV